MPGINRTTGLDYHEWVNRERKSLFSRWSKFDVRYVGREVPPPPRLTLDALDHPIVAWAELESLRVTGDCKRLALVYEPLVWYYRALQKYVRQGNGLYMTDWASMDNSPRNGYLAGGGTAVDTSSQMVMFASQLAEIADLLGKSQEAGSFRSEAAVLGQTIRQLNVGPRSPVLLRPDARRQACPCTDDRRLLDPAGRRGVTGPGRCACRGAG